jgi:hypothetical protein
MEVSDVQHVNQILSAWQDDPKGMMTVIGTVIGESAPRYIQQLYEGWGTGLFHRNHLPERINFLYDEDVRPINRAAQTKLRKEIELSRRDGVVCITDKQGDHGYINLMLLRGMSDNMEVCYSIREFVLEDEFPTGFLGRHWPRARDLPMFEAVLGPVSATSPDFFGIGTDTKMRYLHVFDDDPTFWNFVVHEDHLDATPESFGWRDIGETTSITRLICFCTNLLGFAVK